MIFALSIGLGLLSVSPIFFIANAIRIASKQRLDVSGDNVVTGARVIRTELTEVHGDTGSWRGE